MIESKTNKIIYLGNGINRVFNISFDVINYSTDLKLFLTEVNSNEITEIQNNFYIDEVNKTVTYPTVDSGLQPLSSDEQIVILRETNITQELDSKNFFKSSDVEFIADKLTMIAQDLKEKTDRSFIGPVTSNENYSEDVIDAIAEEVSSKINAEQIISEHNSDEAAHPYLLNETNTLKNDLGDLGDQVAGIEAKIPAEAGETNQLADKRFVRDLASALNFVKWVDALPETGESKYIYAVPREETDTEGKQIAALYLWDGSAWRGAGAFSLNIDPDTLATKTELSGYLPKTGGYIGGTLSIAREKGLIDTLMPESGSGSGYTRLRVYSYDRGWVGHVLHNSGGEASILLEDAGHLNIRIGNNSEVRIGGKRILTIGDKGVANGLASLDANGKVPLSQLPDNIVGGSANIPAFPAPAEQTSSESYSEALGYQHFENKAISSITFQREPNDIVKTGVVDGIKTLSFKLGGIWDIILNFTVESGAVTYANLEAQKDGASYGSFQFIEGGQYLTWDTSTWLEDCQIYFDSTNRAISADFYFKANDISALSDFTDESLSFTLKEAVNPLPAASDYENQLAYVYEDGEYSDIKNLIYSDGTSWQFLPGAVLQIPDERMKAASILETPAYCGIELKTGQFAIPSRNKNDMAPYYNVGQMHELYIQQDNPLNRYWRAMIFGTQFNQTMNELAQTNDEEAVSFWPQNYTETTFINKSETIHTQNIKLFLTSQYSYCNLIFCQGTNKIKLTFEEKPEGAKIFYNGTDITVQSELMLDTDAKTVIGKTYSNNYNDCILELYDLPYSSTGGGGGAPTLKWYKNNTGSSITIDDTSSSSLVKVYKNGVLLEPIEDYTISGTTLTLTTELISTDKITTEVF